MTAADRLTRAAALFRAGNTRDARALVAEARDTAPRSAALAGYWQAIATPAPVDAARSCDRLAARLTPPHVTWTPPSLACPDCGESAPVHAWTIDAEEAHCPHCAAPVALVDVDVTAW